MWYLVHLTAATVFCCIGERTIFDAGYEGGHFRSCAEDRSSGSERVPYRIESAPKCVERHKKNGVQSAAGHFLQVLISETSPLNPVRNDQLVRLVQVKKALFSRATHSREMVKNYQQDEEGSI
ncbi:MAG: hypothetical protein KDA77_00340 [Planctomycetaceae bacterium]|nr:hypothetical protein [Planctomycetaceae bacterium]